MPVYLGVTLSADNSTTAEVASQLFRRIGGLVGGLVGFAGATRGAASLSPAVSVSTTATMSAEASTAADASAKKLTPVYFVSHGGVSRSSKCDSWSDMSERVLTVRNDNSQM